MVAVPLGERGHSFLKYAHQCYLHAQCTIPSLVPFGDIVRLLLSSQNNQMSIYQEFAMHAEARICLDLLTRLLTTSIAADSRVRLPSPPLSALPGNDTWAGFSTATSTSTRNITLTTPQAEKVATDEILLNLMVLMRPDSAPAA